MTNEEHSIKRLAHLSARELSALLRGSLEEAQEYLESADSTPFMQAPVEKVREDLRRRQESSGQAHNIPHDVAARWVQVRSLLFREPEFETRYPAAYTLLLEPHFREIGDELIGISLPSFGVRILQHAPETRGPNISRHDRHHDTFSSRYPGSRKRGACPHGRSSSGSP